MLLRARSGRGGVARAATFGVGRWLSGAATEHPLKPALRRHMESLHRRYDQLQEEVTTESFSVARMKELARLGEVTATHAELEAKAQEVAELHELAADATAEAELRALARAELPDCETEVLERKDRLLALMVPSDPDDDRDVVLEVRAGAGGLEASLFAGELFEMYSKHARRHGWHFAVHDYSEVDGLGGLREAAAGITSTDAVDVCVRPRFSVAGTRCTRCTPVSPRSTSWTPSPLIRAAASRRPPRPSTSE